MVDVRIILLSKDPLNRVSPSATNTTIAPTQGVFINPDASTIKPPLHAPSAIPTLNAAIFKPDATSTALGVYCSANFTTYICKPGTLPKANAPRLILWQQLLLDSVQ